MTVHDRVPRLRDCRRAEPAAAGFAGWVEGAGIALPGGPAPTARAWRGACVHRSAQARVSRQYHRMSSHALPPSGIIWSSGKGMPHSQHETTAVRRPAGPVGEEVPVASAMTASPPHREPLSVRVRVGQPQEPAPTAAAPLCSPARSAFLARDAQMGPRSASSKCCLGGAGRDSRTMLPSGRGPRRVTPIRGAGRTSQHSTFPRRCQRRYSANEARGCGYTLSEPSAGSQG